MQKQLFMKKLFITLCCFALLPLTIDAQITITRNDMPNVGDSLILTSTIVPPGIDYTASGTNFNWDFSSLTGGSQNTHVYVAVSSTPFLYQAVFNWPPWNAPASIASPEDDVTLIPGVAFTDYYDFFKEQNASYTAVGFGVTINNVPVPVKYNNPEMLYKFPLNFGNPPDSSESFYNINIPDVGYYETYRKRVNSVDGWGTLTTPFGTFTTLRLKSVLTIRDSIYVDSLQNGIPINRDITEYKWLGNGFGIPLLKVSKEGLLPAQAEYLAEQQEPLTVDAGMDVTILQGEQVQLQALVTGGSPPYGLLWSNGAVGNPITVNPQITTTYTVNVVDAGFNFVSDMVTVNVVPASEHQVTLSQGWSGISSWLVPLQTDLEIMMQPIEDFFVILQNLDGVYHPAATINTLEYWDHNSGYMIKTTSPVMLTVTGHKPENTPMQLTAGWNLIPVRGSCLVEIAGLYAQISSELVIVKDAVGLGIFWPEQSVSTMNALMPGNAYLIKVNENCTIAFPDCD